LIGATNPRFEFEGADILTRDLARPWQHTSCDWTRLDSKVAAASQTIDEQRTNEEERESQGPAIAFMTIRNSPAVIKR